MATSAAGEISIMYESVPPQQQPGAPVAVVRLARRVAFMMLVDGAPLVECAAHLPAALRAFGSRADVDTRSLLLGPAMAEEEGAAAAAAAPLSALCGGSAWCPHARAGLPFDASMVLCAPAVTMTRRTGRAGRRGGAEEQEAPPLLVARANDEGVVSALLPAAAADTIERLVGQSAGRVVGQAWRPAGAPLRPVARTTSEDEGVDRATWVAAWAALLAAGDQAK